MIRILLLALSLSSFGAGADLPKNEKIWSSRDSRWLALDEWRRDISAGDVIVVGEQHATGETLAERVHHGNQVRLLAALSAGLPVSVGMEFLEYPKQDLVDQYLDGWLTDTDFQRLVGWGGNTWTLYRDQILWPASSGGRTYALNIPRALTSKVGRTGPESLSAEERALLPPVWEQGSPAYLDRFREAMGGHVAEDKLLNYFWAQSLWDDTMAWRISLSHEASGVLVAITGEFHVEYGLGLPARLARYGVSGVKTLVQTEVAEWSDEALAKAVAADAAYGARADYIWVYQLPTAGE